MDTTNEITPEESVVPVYQIPMTAEEIAASEYGYQLELAEQQRIEQMQQARQTAIAKLEAIGLTTEEITALIGGN